MYISTNRIQVADEKRVRLIYSSVFQIVKWLIVQPQNVHIVHAYLP